MFWGLILIVVGLFLLLQNLGFIPGGLWDILWPVALMAFGLSMVLRRLSPRHAQWCTCPKCRGPVQPQ